MYLILEVELIVISLQAKIRVQNTKLYNDKSLKLSFNCSTNHFVTSSNHECFSASAQVILRSQSTSNSYLNKSQPKSSISGNTSDLEAGSNSNPIKRRSQQS